MYVVRTMSGQTVTYLIMSLLLVFTVALWQLRSQLSAPQARLAKQIENAAQAIEVMSRKAWPERLTQSQMKSLGVIHLTRTPDPLFNQELAQAQDTTETLLARLIKLNVIDIKASYSPVGRPVLLADRVVADARFEHLNVSVKLADRDWMNLTIQPSLRPAGGLLPFFFPALVIATVVAVGAIMSARATRPLKEMGLASQKLATGYTHEPLALRGPVDVREALDAFNTMGHELEATIARQRHILEAIGHDLNTPINSLRLRAEMLDSGADRDKIMRAIDELQRLTDAALHATTAGKSREPHDLLDISSVLASICDDLADMGQPVCCHLPEVRPIIAGQPEELIRAFRNIIENAVRYGKRATVSLDLLEETCRITVADEGDGIPEDLHTQVFDPLHRLEASRNKATGGHGLGLYIAKAIIDAHHGAIALRNLVPVGLAVEITLPTVRRDTS